MMKLLITVWLLIITYRVCSIEVCHWNIVNENGKIKLSNVTSPIDVYSALYQQSIIDWPLKGFNDVKYRWIAYDNWTFISDPFPLSAAKSTSLFVSGLDITPLIFLNDVFIGTTSSQFLSQDFILNSSSIKRSDNVLKLFFYSPVLIANRTAQRIAYEVPPNCWPNEYNGECHINFIRKTQASFGWDWGPAIPTVGIRGKIELYQTNDLMGQIRTVRLLTNSNSDCSMWSATINLKAFVLKADTKAKLCASIGISILYLNLTKCTQVKTNGIIEFNFSLPIKFQEIDLWWPYELGNPTLYLLNTVLSSSNKILDKRSQYVGFRHVSLNQTQIPNKKGRIFEFFVNCKSLFIKGTNWVPRTYLTLGWNNKSQIEFLLNSVRIANMNAIRLWGGGKPEDDHFYDVADRLGLMVWHDLMFACSLYPNDDEFTSVVHNEVSEIISKLQIHPCILLWSGNNEIEVLIAQGWYNTTKMDLKNIARYYNLFGKVIKDAVTTVDPYIPYIWSSPSNGVESEKSQGVSRNPQSPYYGDVHFYVYDGDLWNASLYPITRMTTEFGFQSLPEAETWRHIVFSEKDFDINGTLMKHVQHHPDGNPQLSAAILLYFGKLFPNQSKNTTEQYKWFSYLSQINQANILKVHINKLRSSQCMLTSDGIGLTRGAMYWQLNDNWIAPTWSSIDYLGHWKLAHYYVKSSFSSNRINFGLMNNYVTLTLIEAENIRSIQYDVIILSQNVSQKIQTSVTGRKTIKFITDQKCNVHVIAKWTIDDFMRNLNCTDVRKCLFIVNLELDGVILSSDSFMATNPKNVDITSEISRDKIFTKISQNTIDHSICSIIMHSEYIHLYVTLTTTTLGVFSDNGIHLTDQEKTITFDPWLLHANGFFNCSLLHIDVYSINGLYN